MEPSKDPISVRVAQLNSQLVSTKLSENNSNLITREGLLDALSVLYNECSSDCLKKYDQQIAAFVDKQRTVLNQVKGLRVNITDFEVKNVIGRGHFGEVHVVKEKQTGDVYAMKTVKKSMCLSQKNISFEEERNIMAISGSPWLTSLQYAFQDTNQLYFIMEYHPGGDLMGLLQRQGGTIPESASCFYIAELVLALNDLHNMGYVHRDVKPDNILLDRCGHIKLADFGSAAKLNSKKFVSEGIPVGTPNYIAPEVLQSMDNKNIKKSDYGISCDYWSVGVLAYQLTVGNAPFNGTNTTNTYSKIMNYKVNLKFPPDILLSQAYVSLIKSLLTDPSLRLNYEQILKHALFKKTDFDSLKNQVPPYVPKIDSVDDTSNFFDIPSKKSEPNIDNFKTKTQFSGRHLPFIGFTFTHDLYEFKPSYSSNSLETVKNERIEELQKEIRTLQKELQQHKDSTQDKENMEKKLEEKSRQLENLEDLRDRLERDLANSIAECSALKRTLELERKDRNDLERKALELIKSAKLKWENSEKIKIDSLNLELTQQKEKIQQLTNTNSFLNEQLQHALQLKDKHKTSLESVQHLNRQSIVGLESRLEKMTSDTKNKLAELQNKLVDEVHQKTLLQNQITNYQYTQASLKEKLKTSEENCNSLLMKLETNQKLIRELENKIEILEKSTRIIEEEKNKNRLLEEQVVKLKNDHKVDELKKELKREKDASLVLQKQIQGLKEELNSSTALHESFIQEQKDNFTEQLQEIREQLSKLVEEKGNLESQLKKAQFNEQSNKIKVQSLEDLLKRLESGVSKLENDCDKENVLKGQVERLEQQLIQVHENCAVDKQELNQLKSKFWRMEKDLSNAEIDIRIYKRELKESEEEKKKLSLEIESLNNKIAENTKMHESALLELSNLNEDLANEIIKLQELMKHLEGKIETEKEKCDEEKGIVSELKADVESKRNALSTALKNLEISKHETVELQRKLEFVENVKNDLLKQVEATTKDKNLIKNDLENCQRELRNTQLNLNALREACTLLENQLVEYENIHASFETKQKSLTANTEKLISELAQAKEEIRQTKAAVNEECSLKLCAETKCKRLAEDIECLKNECSSYKQQCVDFRQYSSSLTDELTSAEEKLTDYEVTIKSYERQISSMMMENKMLKEENSAQLTHLNDIKESNYQLGQQLTEYKRTNNDFLRNINELENTLAQKMNFYKERELKTDGTIQQQTKLIDFLQSKMEESKKKKTLSDKIFGHCKKENQPPLPVALNYKDLESLLHKERDINKDLREEISRLKTDLNIKHGKDNVCETVNTPMSPRTKVALEKLAQSPNPQKSDLFRQNSTQRMYHNIPHRFESKLCTKTSKCAHCSNQTILGRNIKFCTECHVMVHPNCAKYLPKTCGVPQAYVKHYSESLSKLKNSENTKNEDKEQEKNEDVNIEGWVKIPVRGNTGWDRHYACLTSSSLKIYAQPPNNTNISPVEILELHPANTYGSVVLEPVLSEIGTPVATSDLPFIIKVDIIPNTTCWPPKSIILMTLSIQDKEKWFKALQAVFNKSDQKYVGELILKYNDDMQINCMVDLNNDTKLLGTKDGLYSYRNNTLLHIAGPLNVYQISTAHTLNLAIMIADSNKYLITCDLKRLNDLTKCAPCSKPTLTFKTVNINNMEGFHLFEILHSKKDPILAAATTKQLILMSYDYESSEFVIDRILDTAQPTSCILFTEHSLIVGANKFFEIDLMNFQAHEFLDESDVKLSQVMLCYQVGSLPVAIMRVSNDPIEYLLCFLEFAIFVDEIGRCSRATDIKWSRLPQAIHYQAPYLYLVQFSAVEIIKIAPDTCNIMKNSMESLLNVDNLKIDIKNPRMLGKGKKGVYIDVTNEIRIVQGRQIDEDSISLSSESTQQSDDKESLNSNDSDEFSFTSSMVQSLDGNLSNVESVDSEDGPEGFTSTQKKVTFDSRVTNL